MAGENDVNMQDNNSNNVLRWNVKV